MNNLAHQLAWLKRRLFGAKSEKRHPVDNGLQMSLAQVRDVAQDASAATKPVTAHLRKATVRDADASSANFFDEARVPIESIALPDPATAGLIAAQIEERFERNGEKDSHRLAQRLGSFVVLKYVRPILKACDTQMICAAQAPRGVIEGSRSDFSFIIGVLRDIADSDRAWDAA